MFDATPLLHLYARWRNSFLAKNLPTSLQQTQLLNLVRKAANTKFGKDHGFSSITSVEDYQKRVPLRTYEQFWNQYWKDAFPVLKDCTWPGTIPFFPVSSGTSSGVTKYIPCTHEMIASNTKAGMDLLVYHINNRPNSKILAGKSFLLGGSTDLAEVAPGVFQGDLSGITNKQVPWWIKSRYFPPADVALVKNWEEKIDLLGELSLKQDIRMISGVPAWLMIFFDRLKTLIKKSDATLSELYPNIEMIVHGGVNFSPYLERFQHILGNSDAELREVYPASEGFVAVADRMFGDGLKMNLDHNMFFEFVPFSELDSPNPTRHWIGNIEKDVNYAIVLTTCAGLWSYVIGDTVRFVDTTTPRILVTGRTSYYLSAFGEHLIAEEIEDGVVTAAKQTNVEITDYTVGPYFPQRENELGGHIYLIEFTKTAPQPDVLETFTQILDRRLCERNEDYEAHRADGFGLNGPTIIPVEEGFFAQWMKSRGKLGGQNKVPRIITKPELFDDIQAFAKDYHQSSENNEKSHGFS